jgi:ATP-binding cassette, subfamily G (WHITE), eye pigment precursor transporter
MVIVYWMVSLNNDFVRFVICTGIVILVAQSASSFGTFLSACVPNVDVGIALAGPVLVPQIIFSGFLLNLESVSFIFLPLRYLSWFGYANEALMVNQWKGLKIKCGDDNSTDAEAMMRPCMRTGEDVLDSLNMKEVNLHLKLNFTKKKF